MVRCKSQLACGAHVLLPIAQSRCLGLSETDIHINIYTFIHIYIYTYKHIYKREATTHHDELLHLSAWQLNTISVFVSINCSWQLVRKYNDTSALPLHGCVTVLKWLPLVTGDQVYITDNVHNIQPVMSTMSFSTCYYELEASHQIISTRTLSYSRGY